MALDPRQFCDVALQANGIDVAFGVPDSVLSGLASYLSETKSATEHIVMASEGAAVALAAGYYLSTRKLALVYMQNSGLANAFNPLQSLAVKEVFGIPMLLMIGWRGMPGVKDEPQHALTGPRLLDIIASNDIPYEQLPHSLPEAGEAIARLVAVAQERQTPVAVIVPPKSFARYTSNAAPRLQAPRPIRCAMQDLKSDSCGPPSLSREAAIRCVLDQAQKDDIVVCSLGGATRELHMIRQETQGSLGSDFMCIGAMGHTFALAHGISMGCPQRRVICIDGDGSFLMHVGNSAILAMTGQQKNIVHIVMHNQTYGSTGDQPLTLGETQFVDMAQGLPYEQKFLVDDLEALTRAYNSASVNALIIVTLNTSVRDNLPRPAGKPQTWKDEFMRSLL